MDRIYDEASQVEAEQGNVSVEGPDGVSVLLTPEAAEETSDRLQDAAAAAVGQRRVETLRKSPPN